MYVCRYRVEKYVMNENKDKLSLMDGEQPPIIWELLLLNTGEDNDVYKDLR